MFQYFILPFTKFKSTTNVLIEEIIQTSTMTIIVTDQIQTYHFLCQEAICIIQGHIQQKSTKSWEWLLRN